MAPECFRSEEYTEKADVYSFGVILWELVTAGIPWSDLSQWSITYQVGMAGKRLEVGVWGEVGEGGEGLEKRKMNLNKISPN